MIKTGFVALVGRPNVGKSTLMNHVIGQKIAITSEKPQTTRGRIQTVYDDERGQIIFLDTPGIHKAANKLGEYMDHVAEKTLEDVDVIVWLVEPTTYIGAGEQHIAEVMKKYDKPKILVINKIDTLKDPAVELTAAADKYPAEISGGMQKRAGLARAIVRDSDIVLYDEPTSGLDPVTSVTINRLIRKLNRSHGITSVVVTHDLQGALQIADRILLLKGGKAIACLPPADFLKSDNRDVKEFLAAMRGEMI